MESDAKAYITNNIRVSSSVLVAQGHAVLSDPATAFDRKAQLLSATLSIKPR